MRDETASHLARLPQRVEIEEVSLLDVVMRLEELEASDQDVALGVLEGNAKEDDGPSVVPVEIDSLRNFPPGDGEEHCPLAAVARFSVVCQGEAATTNGAKQRVRIGWGLW